MTVLLNGEQNGVRLWIHGAEESGLVSDPEISAGVSFWADAPDTPDSADDGEEGGTGTE